MIFISINSIVGYLAYFLRILEVEELLYYIKSSEINTLEQKFSSLML